MIDRDAVIKHFDSVAKTYRLNYEGNSIVSRSFSTRLNIVLSLIGDVDGKSILDIGCGNGILARSLAHKNCEFIGIDVSEGMIKECLTDSQLARCVFQATEPLVFFEENTKKMFHIIICMGLFEYLTDEYTHNLMEGIAAHLYPNGVLIATYPNVCSPYRLFDRLYRKLSHRRDIMVPPYTPGIAHREFFENKLKKEWSRYHIEMDKSLYYNFRLIPKPLDNKLKILDLFIAKRLQVLEESCLRFLATAMVLRGRKK